MSIKTKIDNGDYDVSGGMSLLVEDIDNLTDHVVPDIDKTELYICDSTGRVVAKVNNLGIQAIKYLNKQGVEIEALIYTPSIYGIEIFTIGDSFSSGNLYQSKIVELTGCIFDNDKNTDETYPLSAGGTKTIGSYDYCGQMRLKNLLSQYPNAKQIIYQNVNDYTIALGVGGSMTDESYFMSQLLTHGTTYASVSDVYTNKMVAISSHTGEDRVSQSAIRIPYTSLTGKNIQITGVASADGQIILTVGGTAYYLNITTGDTIANIIERIIEVDYTDYTDTSNGVDSVDFYTDGAASLLFDANSTGVIASITDAAPTIAYRGFYFASNNIANWDDTAYWKDSLSLYSQYKGICEFVQKNFPEAKFYWFIATRLAIAYTSSHPDYDATLWNADDSFNIDAYRLTEPYLGHDVAFRDIILEVCESYGIPVIDAIDEGSMTPYNIEYYYFDKNVHPKTLGFERWGEILSKNLK